MPKIKCPECGNDVGVTYLPQHMARYHVPCPVRGCSAKVARDKLAEHIAQAHPEVK